MIEKFNINDFIDKNRILIKNNGYIYLSPNSLLKSYISNYTIAFPNKTVISSNYSVIPHGSGTLVFGIDENSCSCNLFGPTTKANIVGNDANKFLMLLIIEFHPWGLYNFINIDQSELLNSIYHLEIIIKSLQEKIVEVIEISDNINDLILKLDSILLSYINKSNYNKKVEAMAKHIIYNNGIDSIKDLSNKFNYSRRHLNRIFKQHIGVSLKSFSHLVRINNSIKLLKKTNYTITQISYTLGFYDQSHFIHTFKEICNVTPKEYLKYMSHFYNEIAKF